MGGYRDDHAALQAKVSELEGALAASRAHVARLKGLTGPTRKNDSLVGAPVHHLDELELPHRVSQAGCEAIAAVLRHRLGLQTSVAEGEVTGQATGFLAAEGTKRFTLTRSAEPSEGCRLRLETDAQRLPVLVALGPIVGGLTSLPYGLWQMNLLHHFEPAETLGTTLAAAAFATLLGGWLTRRWAKRRARALQRAHDGVWAAVTELAQERAAPRVRIAASEPGASEPGASEPSASEPSASEPGASEPEASASDADGHDAARAAQR